MQPLIFDACIAQTTNIKNGLPRKFNPNINGNNETTQRKMLMHSYTQRHSHTHSQKRKGADHETKKMIFKKPAHICTLWLWINISKSKNAPKKAQTNIYTNCDQIETKRVSQRFSPFLLLAPTSPAPFTSLSPFVMVESCHTVHARNSRHTIRRPRVTWLAGCLSVWLMKKKKEDKHAQPKDMFSAHLHSARWKLD